ncbi:ATPase SWSAP1 isoform X3 [Talpa occidentalis]|uniref:ATPase SWSAP1 isoform X3 n=1 Tax=Talpa occidentalis TaxID=50954 RepID=UPI0023F8386B|nr:ATPase SWSAP1 isoform X3 [Talpa occidentalis]
MCGTSITDPELRRCLLMYQYSDTEKQAHSPSIFPLLNCHWVTSAETHTAAITVLIFQKIRFQYPRSTRELHRLLCSAHETPGPAPSLLLLDGLEKYLMEDLGTQGTAHLAALLLDTAAHFSHRAGPGRGCGLIVTLQTQEEGYSGDVLQLLLLQRYFPAQCWLHLEGPGPGPQRLQICLEPGGLGSRAEWWMSFQQDGEMTITSCATQTCNPSSEKSSSSGGQS